MIEDAVLARSEDPAEKRREALTALEGAIGAGEASAVNLDDFADEDIVFPARPDPPIALSDLRYVLDHPKLLPKGSEASPLDGKDYRFLRQGASPRSPDHG